MAEREIEFIKEDDLLSLLENLDSVLDVIKNPANMFKGPNGGVLAALKIQTAWRRHKAYSSYTQLQILMIKAAIIQRSFRLYQLKKSTKEKVRRLGNESIEVWREM